MVTIIHLFASNLPTRRTHMPRKTASSKQEPPAVKSVQQNLGTYLSNLRSMKKLTLRQVEEATEKEVSNAYLSQLETGKISKPSPSVLHSLAKVYGVEYEMLMQKAGYLSVTRGNEVLRSGKLPIVERAAVFAGETLTPLEEEKLLEYLSFIRSRKS